MTWFPLFLNDYRYFTYPGLQAPVSFLRGEAANKKRLASLLMSGHAHFGARRVSPSHLSM
jgi:hypothetical protein